MRKVILAWLLLSGGVFAQDVSWSLMDVKKSSANYDLMYKSKEDGWKALAVSARREGRAMQLDMEIDGKWERFVATPDGQVFVQRERIVPATTTVREEYIVPQEQTVQYRSPPRQGVAVAYQAPTFQRGGIQRIPGTPYHEGHRCPACNHESPDGQGTWVIRSGRANGVHVHSCPRCGQSWKHRG